jgi:hypothetical protein
VSILTKFGFSRLAENPCSGQPIEIFHDFLPRKIECTVSIAFKLNSPSSFPRKKLRKVHQFDAAMRKTGLNPVLTFAAVNLAFRTPNHDLILMKRNHKFSDPTSLLIPLIFLGLQGHCEDLHVASQPTIIGILQ